MGAVAACCFGKLYSIFLKKFDGFFVKYPSKITNLPWFAPKSPKKDITNPAKRNPRMTTKRDPLPRKKAKFPTQKCPSLEKSSTRMIFRITVSLIPKRTIMTVILEHPKNLQRKNQLRKKARKLLARKRHQ